ncbi:tumor necrosis factor ligand superfamily member 12 [Liasis olivaceus]
MQAAAGSRSSACTFPAPRFRVARQAPGLIAGGARTLLPSRDRPEGRGGAAAGTPAKSPPPLRAGVRGVLALRSLPPAGAPKPPAPAGWESWGSESGPSGKPAGPSAALQKAAPPRRGERGSRRRRRAKVDCARPRRLSGPLPLAGLPRAPDSLALPAVSCASARPGWRRRRAPAGSPRPAPPAGVSCPQFPGCASRRTGRCRCRWRCWQAAERGLPSMASLPPPPPAAAAPPPPPPPAPAASWRLATAARRRPPRAPAPAMGRRRRAREPPARLVLLALALASGSALLLASLSLLLAAWPRSGARAVQQDAAAAAAAALPQELLPEDDPEELAPVVLSTSWNNQGKFLHHFAQQGALRHRRHAEKGKRVRPCRTGTICAAHYEVQATVGRAGMQADANGTIRGWAEAKLNATNPLRYDSSRGEFTVMKKGLYYLYCQVHFNEGKTIYMKLDVMLGGELALRCLEQFPPTSSGPQEAELRVCQVSGLVLLRPEESIRLRTIPRVRLKADRYLTYFGLFQVH